MRNILFASLSTRRSVALILLCCLIVTLYLAPSKESIGDFLVAGMMVAGFSVLNVDRKIFVSAVKPTLPLLVMISFVIISDFYSGGDGAFLKLLLIGMLPYFLFYMVFKSAFNKKYAIAVLLVPGLIHLGYLCMDMLIAIWHGNVSFSSSAREGLLEQVKNTPRVGRRYGSVALVQLLVAGAVISTSYKYSAARKLGWLLSFISIIILVLLDARAAYVSIFIACWLMILAAGPSRSWRAVKGWLPKKVLNQLILIVFVLVAANLGYSAGKSRWISLGYSFSAAAHDVFESEVDLALRPYVNTAYWSEPVADYSKCWREEHFRCMVDQSAYLRFAWVLVGIKSLAEHPFGIGYTKNYMERLWGVDSSNNVYSHNDSFLIEIAVAFGFPGLLLYSIFIFSVLRSFRRVVKRGCASPMLVAVFALLLACFGRSVIDQFNEGLWRYMMVLLGVYYGLLHADQSESKSDELQKGAFV